MESSYSFMAGVSRTRKMEVNPPIVGYYLPYPYGGPVKIWDTRPADIKTTTDVTGNRMGENPFSSSVTERRSCFLYGDGGLYRDMDTCHVPTSFPALYASVPTALSQVSRIMSQTGPLTPNLYLPVSLFELRDIPRMLKHVGDLLHGIGVAKLATPKGAAEATLAVQFGWKPLLEDMGKMLQFADTVKRRQRTLLGAHRVRGVRRRISLGGDQKVVEGSQTLNSTGSLFVSSKYTETQKYKRWATMRWTVRDTSQIGEMPSFNEAFRISMGLNKGYIPIEVWKALPWSWAIDWFADISNKMQASHNMVYYKPSSICVMTLYESKRVYFGSKGPKWVLSPGETLRTSKTRAILAPVNTLSLRLPFLDNFKLSILGSMAILRLHR